MGAFQGQQDQLILPVCTWSPLRGFGKLGSLMHFWKECTLVQSLWKMIWSFLKTFKIGLAYDPAVPLSKFVKELKSLYWRHTCTPVCVTELFTVDKTWDQPRYPSADGRDKENVICKQNRRLCSHGREWHVVICSKTWTGRISCSMKKVQHRKAVPHDFPHLKNLTKLISWKYRENIYRKLGRVEGEVRMRRDWSTGARWELHSRSKYWCCSAQWDDCNLPYLYFVFQNNLKKGIWVFSPQRDGKCWRWRIY